MSYHNLVTFNAMQYDDYDDACKHGGIYVTPSTVDAMSCRSGMYDIEEVCRTLFDAAGLENDFAVGVVADNGEFVTLDAITTKMGEDEFCNAEPDEVINQLADLQKYAGDRRAMAIESMGQSIDAYNCIGINTSHLSTLAQSDLNGLANTSEMVFARDTGWFVKLYDDVECNNKMFKDSPELQHIAELALASEHRMIEFDGDAAYYLGLPQFDDEMGEVVHFEAGQHIPEHVQKDLVADQKLSEDEEGHRNSLNIEEFCCDLSWKAAVKFAKNATSATPVISADIFFKTQEKSLPAWPVIVLDTDHSYIMFGLLDENVTVTHSKMGYQRTLKVPQRLANVVKLTSMLTKLTGTLVTV